MKKNKILKRKKKNIYIYNKKTQRETTFPTEPRVDVSSSLRPLRWMLRGPLHPWPVAKRRWN